MAFAKAEDVQKRLGRDLTPAQKEAAESVIATVTGLIADVAGRDAEWAEALDPVPEALKALCVEKAIGAVTNPTNLARESETLGQYSRDRTFPRSADISVFLSDLEERLVTRTVYGSNSGSAVARSVVNRVVEMREGVEP